MLKGLAIAATVTAVAVVGGTQLVGDACSCPSPTFVSGGAPGNVFMSPTGSDSGANCQRFSSPTTNPGGSVCQTLTKAYNLAQKGDTVVMQGGTYGSTLTVASGASAKSSAGSGCDKYAGDVAGCVNFVPENGATVNWTGGAEIKVEVPYVHLKGIKIAASPHGDIYNGINSPTANVAGIWLDHVDIPQVFATGVNGFAITDSRVGPCQTDVSYATCDSQIKAPASTSDSATLEHNILIDHTVFHDTWRTGSLDHNECLLIFDAKQARISNSQFQNCGIIDMYLTSFGNHTTTDVVIENNVFDDPGSHAPTSPSNQTSQALLVETQSDTQNVTVRNNSFIGAQMITQIRNAGNTLGNVIYTGNASGDTTICQSNTTYTFNVFNGSSCGSNSLNANPLFTNTSSNPVDLHVSPSSPVAGRGNSANMPTLDQDGRTRPSPPAAGAFEP